MARSSGLRFAACRSVASRTIAAKRVKGCAAAGHRHQCRGANPPDAYTGAEWSKVSVERIRRYLGRFEASVSEGARRKPLGLWRTSRRAGEGARQAHQPTAAAKHRQTSSPGAGSRRSSAGDRWWTGPSRYRVRCARSDRRRSPGHPCLVLGAGFARRSTTPASCNSLVPLKAVRGFGIISIDPDHRGSSGLARFPSDFAIKAIELQHWDVRVVSSTIALTYVATGRLAGAVYLTRGSALHCAAGALMVREAGAIASDESGREWTIRSAILVVAATDELHTELQRLTVDLHARLIRQAADTWLEATAASA